MRKMCSTSKQNDSLAKGLWLCVETAGNVAGVFSRVLRKLDVRSSPIDSKAKIAIFLN